MIALPIYLQMVFEYNALQAGISLAPLSLSTFAVALIASRKAGGRRPSAIIRVGFALLVVGVVVLLPIIPSAQNAWAPAIPLLLIGSGLGLLVSQLRTTTLPGAGGRVSEAAGSTPLVARSASRSAWPSQRDHAGRALDHLHRPGQRQPRLAPAEQERVATRSKTTPR